MDLSKGVRYSFGSNQGGIKVRQDLDIICIGTALVDSIIRGFDPNPVSASGYRAA